MPKKEINAVIGKWLEGNESAFNEVVGYYFPQMQAFAHQMIPNTEDAEELVMNAFLKLWQHKSRIVYVSRPDEYLFGILRREIVGYARKRVLAVESIEQVDLSRLGVVEHPELALSEIRAKYQTALDKLTERQRAVFLLSREEGLSQKEIAKATGISINTVGNHMNAALKVFREEMKEYPEMFVFLLSPTFYLFVAYC